jgi:hypothetical protein
MGAWGGGGGGGSESESNASTIGVGIKRQRVGECRPAVSLLLRRKGDEQDQSSSKPAEGNAADTANGVGRDPLPNGNGGGVVDGDAGGGADGGSNSGGLSLLAGYGSDEGED